MPCNAAGGIGAPGAIIGTVLSSANGRGADARFVDLYAQSGRHFEAAIAQREWLHELVRHARIFRGVELEHAFAQQRGTAYVSPQPTSPESVLILTISAWRAALNAPAGPVGRLSW
jgi:hypothetical protein